MNTVAALVDAAAAGQRHAVARLVSLLEDSRDGRRADQAEAMRALAALGRRRGRIVGVTGTPGSGKSSLVARLTERILALDPAVRLAVVAVDPSSPTSGGALLGDRARMRPAGTDRLFVRSQASATALGGLSPTTYSVCAGLSHLFDIVFVETVGIGQSEADIRHLAHDVYLVVSPLGGDEIQFLKAGIIEIPDAFVISKCDEPAARRTEHQLRASLWLARPFDAEQVKIFATSARRGDGIDELSADILRRAELADGDGRHGLDAARYFFRGWVADEWGRAGLRHLDGLGGAEKMIGAETDLVRARDEFTHSLSATFAQR